MFRWNNGLGKNHITHNFKWRPIKNLHRVSTWNGFSLSLMLLLLFTESHHKMHFLSTQIKYVIFERKCTLMLSPNANNYQRDRKKMGSHIGIECTLTIIQWQLLLLLSKQIWICCVIKWIIRIFFCSLSVVNVSPSTYFHAEYNKIDQSHSTFVGSNKPSK